MRTIRPSGRARTVAVTAVLVPVLGLVAACGVQQDGQAASATSAAPVAAAAAGAGEPLGDAAAVTGAPAPGVGSPVPRLTTTVPGSLPDASASVHSAPADGTGTALLRAVRVGRGDGFDRIVFEFTGTSRPGYRIGWVEPPITADASGDVVEVAGQAFLEVVLEPASGVDPEDGTARYTGPDRVAVDGKVDLVRDLLRTGDFEAVLTWVVGAEAEVPFRVLTLEAPTRVVVDIQTG